MLHYEQIQAPIERHEVIKRLKNYLPAYAKGMDTVFNQTRQHLDTAILRAEALAEQHDPSIGNGPYTGIYSLINVLTKLKNK